MNISNRPSWVPKAEAAAERGRLGYQEADAARERGRLGYKEAAEIILAAREEDPSLTMEAVGDYLGGHGKGWVSKILTWYVEGCDPKGPFSKSPQGERSDVSEQPPSNVSPGKPVASDPPEVIPPRDSTKATLEDLGQIPLPLGSNGAAFDFVPGQGEATMDALAAITYCVKMRHVFDRITSTANMTLVYCTSPDKRRATLEKLNAGLAELLEATTLMHEQVEANLQAMPPVPMFDEVKSPGEAA